MVEVNAVHGTRPRSLLRAVSLPAEHGGWGLTAEPVVLGLLLAPSWAGLMLGGSAVLAFVARTPVKIALGDVRRGHRLERTRLATAVGLVEVLLLAGLAVGSLLLADGPLWVPIVIAAPLLGVELAYDIRARGRRLVPELAGSTGIAAVAALILLADGQALAVALGVWAILAGRAITSIPFVRDQVRRLHGRPGDSRTLVLWDVGALAIVTISAVVTPTLVGGAVAVAAVVALQRASVLAPARTAVVLGIRQSAFGAAVVLATWAGAVIHGGLS